MRFAHSPGSYGEKSVIELFANAISSLRASYDQPFNFRFSALANRPQRACSLRITRSDAWGELGVASAPCGNNASIMFLSASTRCISALTLSISARGVRTGYQKPYHELYESKPENPTPIGAVTNTALLATTQAKEGRGSQCRPGPIQLHGDA